ncbi:MAG: hypothetical protein LBG61_02070 [Burkholderiales bacterium]|jgi:hypothetical protein|nr:hypothetical protein [Burkholderiales bacterium]
MSVNEFESSTKMVEANIIEKGMINEQDVNAHFKEVSAPQETENVQEEIMEFPVFKKSWTAYIVPVLLTLFFLWLDVSTIGYFSTFACAVVFILIAAYGLYNIVVIYSFRFFIDGTGVWIYSGILPWARGTFGVKWRDVDSAVYYQNMFSWLFKSHTVHVGHRFNDQNGINATHVAGGDEFVEMVNNAHQGIINENLAQ